ncbi:non-homologous end joining protein Ku [Streptomyces triticirhizae]|uniref:Non-homologous end joining protein Ku n=1 Tax=Streptomyces triticirhizae TaxID=2483353 RepID=A0A3M2LBM3_9ACTN|nr:Ku protein [Streptomyces triticirhizae]RMI34476.1 Ku protein [Streptomyces triticirhizae]
MRSIWKGSISFGLVTIPIKVVSATENHSVSFRQVHTADEGRIRYRKVCELDGQELSGDEIGKAYQAADGTLVQISDEDLAALPLPTARTVEILGFVPISSVDPYQLDRSYYLAPDSGAAKPYVLLREALRRSGQAAVAKLAMRGRETLALVRTREDEDVLGMHTLLWPDEIRSSEGLAPTEQVTVRDAELDMADTLMDTLGSVDMSELHDEYREAVETLVNAKLEGIEPPSPGEEAARGGRVVDLMAALEDSVRSARESRGEGGEDATVTDISGGGRGGRQAKKSAAGKSTAGRGAAKKSQAKKSTAKKSTAKKSAGKKIASKKSTTKKAAGSRRRAS